MLKTDENPQVDERIWQAWLEKNDALDKVRFARRLRVIGLIAVLVAVSVLLWRFAG